jgi:hypothetical protein
MDPWHATFEQVEADLAGCGYAAEADAVMARAQNEPGRLAFTRDQHAWAAYREADGTWLTGTGTQPRLEREPAAERIREPELEAG